MRRRRLQIRSKIADLCNVTFDFDKTYLPHYDVPEGYDSFPICASCATTG